jgi:outer membrane protein OmpA-like peptidoglycan-associated protein
MMRWATILFALVAYHCHAQSTFVVDTMRQFNDENNQMVCSMVKGRIAIAHQVLSSAYDDRGRTDHAHYELTFARMGSSFNTLEVDEPFPFNDPKFDDGTSCYSDRDSTLYFSSTADYGQNPNHLVQLYASKHIEGSWSRPIAFKANKVNYNSAHPWVNSKGDVFVFSSDRPGGMGKMDLWYCNLLGQDWSDPVWLGEGVNSVDNEVFPTFFRNNIYFSSDRTPAQGYNLYVTTKQSQWRTIEELPAPFNSDADDIQCVFLDDETVFLTSAREGGAGGDDVYLLRAKIAIIEDYIASIECLGEPLRDVELRFVNTLKEVVFEGVSNDTGDMELKNLSFEKRYTVEVDGIADDVLSRSVIYIKNGKGEIIKTYRPGKNGQFYFELLQGDLVGGLKKLENLDESILKVSVTGQVFEEEPGDIGEGELIYVTNDSGELLALTYTSKEGRFQFEELRPLRNYQFKITDDGKTVRMIIDDGDDQLEIPFVNGRAQYNKLTDENSIQLIDEHHRPIFISNDEVFIIRNIYYQFDSVAINSIAQGQLSQMASILMNNPLISIELSSHTDSRGEVNYNLELSKRRALRAKEYLQSIGVLGNRIKALGHGEAMLLNECKDEVDCPEEKHALNRRTEIKIHLEE